MEFLPKLKKIETDDFYYDLFYGGYIDPEKLLKNQEDIDKVKDAINTIREFKSELHDKKLIRII
jgi:hypothetical protein